MKNSIPFWIILLALWIVGGSYLYVSTCCGALGTGFAVLDGSTTVAKSKDNVIFGYASANAEITKTTQNAYQKTVDYLNANPGKVLFLSGLFLDAEEQPNLGFARAEAIRDRLLELGLSAQQMIIGGSTNNDLLVDEGLVYNTLDYDIGDIPNFQLLIEDGEQFSASAPTNLNFEKSQFQVGLPLSNELETAFQQTVKYLQDNPDRNLKITGLYHPSEENSSMLPDLGQARANQIKNLFQDMGLAANRILVGSAESGELIFPGEYLFGGAAYTFEAAPQSYDEKGKIEEIEEELKIESILLYFETDASSLDLDENQRNYFAKLIDYLDNKSSARVNVIGHTDNAGTAKYNQNLSAERAEFIKAYLITNGLNAVQIVTAGKGEVQPIESNATDSGKAKNRRVEVFIQ